MKLYSMMPQGLLEEMCHQGYVRVQRHPKQPLSILNYTEKAQYEGMWNEVTTQCRGLIFDSATGDVVARPFPKFHNFGTALAPSIEPYAPVLVTDKLDGSLGILYPYTNSCGDRCWGIATRGSFTSGQAVWASTHLEQYYPDWEPIPGYTYLFEIIYPENRIVVDYGTTRGPFFLGAVNIESGEVHNGYWSIFKWPGPKVETFDYITLCEALAAPDRPNREGFVIRECGTSNMVKVKQEDYVRLHKIVTGLNARVVWEALRDQRVSELYTFLPDELHSWVGDVSREIEDHYLHVSYCIEMDFNDIKRSLPSGFTRKDFAREATSTAYPWAMFNCLDGRSNAPRIWELVKPRADWKPVGGE